MTDELENLRDTLRQTVQGAWNDEDAVAFASDIEDAVPGDLADEFLDCTQSGQALRPCMKQKVDETGLDDSFEGVWDGAPTSLLTSLRRVQTQFSDEARETIRDIASQNNLSEHNRNCAQAEYGEVSSDLNLDSTPANYQDCVTAVAAAQDIRQDLKRAWGTA